VIKNLGPKMENQPLADTGRKIPPPQTNACVDECHQANSYGCHRHNRAVTHRDAVINDSPKQEGLGDREE
jgi:hypothetical protein